MITIKICDNCGAHCEAGANYCKNCHLPLSEPDYNDGPVIESIDNDDLKKYIGDNSSYYLRKFAKVKNKNVFMQLNFSALLFGPAWFFYRKMNRFAIMYVAIMFIFMSILSVALPMAFESDIDEYYSAKTAYSDYVNNDGEVLVFEEGSTAVVGVNEEFTELQDNLKSAQHRIILIYILIALPGLIVNVIFRLYGNAVYKKHIINNIVSSDIGTISKFKAFLIGIVTVNAVWIVISLLLSQLPAVSHFYGAYNTIYYWML